MQLSSYDHLTQDNIIFNEAKEYKVKDSKIKYKRIPIEVKYPNGKKGALVVETPFLFSFGVNANKNLDTNKLVGYVCQYVFGLKVANQVLKKKNFLMLLTM